MKKLMHGAMLAALLMAASFMTAAANKTDNDKAAIERGRYIVQIGGCNDCHTPGFTQSAGKIPDKDWLTGDALGWRGPWGTTYASNLRLLLADMSETQWIDHAHKLRARPPMPFWALNEMSEADLSALYRFVRSLGDGGATAPAYLPPGQTPAGPYVQFPMPPALAAQ
jgi:mono/diheme cytochrome c family protein